MKKYILILMLLFTLSLPCSTVLAQPPPSQDPSQDSDPVGDPVPIGGGLLILIALGAGYGVVKMKQRSKRKLPS